MALDPRFPRTALAAALSALGAVAWAAPTGGEVVQGTASISQAGTTTTIQQTTARAAINWQQFGIAANESVVFQQPSASSIALNRVLGQDASAILGSLSANGQVFLLNPNGILFGSGAQVNVGGLVASSLGLSDADFMAGSYRFARSGAQAPGAVLNQGSITAPGGVVALIGPDVRNAGAITATGGAIGLAAGDAVTLSLGGSPLLGITINQGALNAVAANDPTGNLSAVGGTLQLSAKAADALVRSAVNNTGVVEADHIVLSADGGSISASRTAKASLIEATASFDVRLGTDSLGVSVESTLAGDISIFNGSRGTSTFAARTAAGSISVTNGAPSGDPGVTVIGNAGSLTGINASGGSVSVVGNRPLRVMAPINGVGVILAGANLVSGGPNAAITISDTVHSTENISLSAPRALLTLSQGSQLDAKGDIKITSSALTAKNALLSAGRMMSIQFGDTGQAGYNLDQVQLKATETIALMGGSAPTGETGRPIELRNVHFEAPNVDIRAADGVTGGSIFVNGPVLFDGNATLQAGTSIGGNTSGREITGSNLDLRAAGSLSLLNARRIAPTAGDVRLVAGMNPGDALVLGAPLELPNPATGRITLEGHSVPIQPYAAHTLSIRTASSIGSAASPYQTNVAALALESTDGEIHATNATGVTVAARTGGGDIELRTANGANQPSGVGRAAGHLTVGTVAGLSGIQTAGQGNVTLLPGDGGNGSNTLFGGLGGYVIVDSPIQAGGRLTMTGGEGGAAGSGGLGGNIRINAPIEAGSVDITAGTGGTAGLGGLTGAGGSVFVDAPVSALASLDVRAGDAGPIPDRSTALAGNPGIVTGSRIELSAGDTLRLGSPIDFVGGPVRLHAGSDPGDAVILDGTIRAEVGGDAVRISGNRFVNNAGAQALTTPNGRWIVWSDSPVGNVFGGLQSGNTAVWDTPYDPAQPTVAAPGNRFVFREPQLLGTVLVKADDQTKVYGDSFTQFTYKATATAGDAASGATYGNAFTDVGGSTSGGPVEVAGVVLSSAGAAPTATRTGGIGGGAGYAIDVDVGAATAPGYTRFIGQGGLLTVQPRAVTVSVGGSKVYDGRTELADARFTVNGLVNGDVLGASGSAAFADKHVGNDKPLALSGVALAANANYVLASAAGAGDITPRALRLVASSDTKVYDRSTVSQGAVQVVGLAEGDTVSGLSQRFDARDAGNRSLLVDAGYRIDDGRSGGNYTVTLEQAAGLITPKTLGATVTASNKVYDGDLAATVASRSLAGVIDGDTVSATGGVASFDTRHAGTGKTVTVTGLGLAGSDAANYRLDGPAITTADITPKALTVGGAQAVSKVYDGTTAATITGATLAGAIGGDDVRLSNAGTGTFADKNVGSGLAVTTAMTLAGAQIGNYTLLQPGALRADITPAPLTVTARDDTRPFTLVPYIGGNGITVSGLLGGDTTAVLGGTLGYTGNSQGALLPGAYSIVPRGLTARNYRIDFVPGRLTITNRFEPPTTEQLLRWLRWLLSGRQP